MTTEQAVEFLKALRAKNIFVKGNGWVEASCLLAKWTHSGREDRRPSFGIHVIPGGRSYFACFACRQGSMEELLHSLELYSKGTGDYDFAKCHEILADEQYVTPLPEYGEFGHRQANQQFEPWPQYWVDSFQPAAWVKESAVYLASRGVPVWLVAQFDLRYDPKRGMVVAPYRDVYGQLAGARGRSIHSMGHPHYDYTFHNVNNARLVWYNEPVLNDPGPVVVVEGQFDCWRTVQAWPKTVANLTAKPTMEKMKKLADCPVVIQIPDRDPAGYESIGRYAQFCHQLGLQHRVIWLDEGVKDPGECHIDYLRDRIQEVLA